MNSSKQRKTGRVVSTQMQNTAVVSVDAFVSHPLYQKKIRKTRRFLAHNPNDKAKLGDTVKIEEIKPMSKRKHWIIADIKPNKEIFEETIEETVVEV